MLHFRLESAIRRIVDMGFAQMKLGAFVESDIRRVIRVTTKVH